MDEESIPEITLNDGLTLPAIGFGTYKLNGNMVPQGSRVPLIVAIDSSIPRIIMKMKERLVKPFVEVLFQEMNCVLRRNCLVATRNTKKLLPLFKNHCIAQI